MLFSCGTLRRSADGGVMIGLSENRELDADKMRTNTPFFLISIA
jgi:hypothetical protein